MDLSSGKCDKKEPSDQLLIKLALEKGSQEAYAELMERYYEHVFLLLLKKTKNNTEAEDLTLEVFGKAFLKLSTYSSDYAFSTWINSIAGNHFIDFYRKKKNNTISIDNRESTNQDIQLSFECKNPDPEEHYIKKEQVLMLRKIIEKLKPKYRLLIELHYYKDCSIAEIAARLTLPEGTVKTRLFRARTFLHNILKSSGPQH